MYVYVLGQGSCVSMISVQITFVILFGWNACVILGRRAYMLINDWGVRIVKWYTCRVLYTKDSEKKGGGECDIPSFNLRKL